MPKRISAKADFDNPAFVSDSPDNIDGTPPIYTIQKDGASLEKRNEEKIVLRREIGLLTSIAFIVGSIIGSGIFVSPAGVVKYCKSVALSLIVWSSSGAFALIAALCYLELSLLIPTSGAEYSYLLGAFGPFHKIFGPMLGFLYAWTYTIIIIPGGNAVKVLAFAEYVTKPFFPCGAPYIAKKLLAALAICIIAFGNCATLKFSKSVQNILTILKLIGLFIILITGIVQLCYGQLDILKTGFENTEENKLIIAKAFYNSFWAYLGWNTLCSTTEEMTRPEKIFPIVIPCGMLLVIFIYVGVNVAYFTVLTVDEIITSDAVAVSFASKTLGAFTFAIPFFVAASVLGSFNSGIYSVGRIGAVAARDGNFPEVLSYIHVDRRTPIITIIISALLSFIMIGPNSIGELINLLGFVLWIFNGLTMLALLVMRYTRRDCPRKYKVFILWPIITLVLSVYLILAPVIETKDLGYLYMLLGILSGLIFYLPCKYFNVDCRNSKFYFSFQKLFLVLPMEYSSEETYFENQNGISNNKKQ